MLLAAAVLFLLNVPGQYVQYVDFDGGFSSRPSVEERIAHGWPALYLARDEWPAAGTVNVPEQSSVWSLFENVLQFKPLVLAADVAVTCVLLMVTGVAFEYWRRQRARVFQVRLTEMLVGTAAIAIVFAYLLSVVREFEHEQAIMRDLGYRPIEYDPAEYTPAWVSGWARRGPAWARPFLGQYDPKCFDRVVEVAVHEDGRLLEHLPSLRHLRVVHVDGARPEWKRDQIGVLAELHYLEALSLPYWPDRLKNNTSNYAQGDAEFARTLGPLAALARLRALNVEDSLFGNQCAAAISGLRQLRVLNLRGTQLNDDGLAHIAKIGTLERLDLELTRVTDEGIRHLASLSKLKMLNLPGPITDKCLPYLAQLPELRELNLDSASIDGSGLAHLTKLTKLELVYLPFGVDRAAVVNLQRRLPELAIMVDGEEFRLTGE
jgi:hypothetical protein